MSHSLYSRQGDKGSTCLPADPHTQVSKDDLVIEFYGTAEELNANLGLLKSKLTLDSPALGEVAEIQRQLYALSLSDSNACPVEHTQIQQLENWIDAKLALLPNQNSAILPGGDTNAALAYICRSICRRAERIAVRLNKQGLASPLIIAYLNRLSDYFLVLARRINQRQGVSDTPLKPTTTSTQD
ncbi:cob(I)yrinic acid a,c-diamide adenosyltransferase [Thalassotalea mangrovi]|uniref:Corrinoid adenosyltransferase n=1 Tax=Thalassotalea mangrovi TaxID=2572245 RepID=A0A4U1B465_9GAMM|nr:cob(I)yrinic acid a,c-diamide adenosyltransferase [Thalassotalea mangrovi]TKB44110.1 cob(I)yrinic acid a,c-diamide adenosyltransferase [Thalassotalea mangrovi]